MANEVLISAELGTALAPAASWRAEVAARRRSAFTDEKKHAYLQELRRTGIQGTAALLAGVTTQTITKHAKLDPDFAQAIEDVFEQRRELIVPVLEKEFLDGHEEVIVRGEGEKQTVITRKILETAARIALIRKYDREGYGDKLQITTGSAGGGVIVIPMKLTDAEWDALYAPKEGGDLTALAEDAPLE